MTARIKCHSSHFLFLIFFVSKSLGIIDTEGLKIIIIIIIIMRSSISHAPRPDRCDFKRLANTISRLTSHVLMVADCSIRGPAAASVRSLTVDRTVRISTWVSMVWLALTTDCGCRLNQAQRVDTTRHFTRWQSVNWTVGSSNRCCSGHSVLCMNFKGSRKQKVCMNHFVIFKYNDQQQVT